MQDCLPDVSTIEITEESKINLSILDELETLGFHRDEVVQSVLKNNFTDSVYPLFPSSLSFHILICVCFNVGCYVFLN